MCIGPDDGCQVVPDPIAPRDMMLVSLDPTRMPMSFPIMTISGPIFVEPIPGMFSMPFIPPISPGEGLAVGIGIFIFCSGEACGFCEAVGFCIPGMFICVCGDGAGEACGICIRGMFICIGCGEDWAAADCVGDDATLAGIFIPGMFIPGMLLRSCFFAVCVFRVAFLFFRNLPFDLDFAFGLLIPGIFDMSCWAKTGRLATISTAAKQSASIVTRELNLSISILFIIPLEENSFGAKRSLSLERQLQQRTNLTCFSETRTDAFPVSELERQGGTKSEKH